MTFTLGEQTLVFLEAVLAGAAGGVCYDLCRALRRRLHLGGLGTALLDGLFWLVVLGWLFYFSVTDAAAQARSYVLLGFGLGFGLYFLCFSQALLLLFQAIVGVLVWACILPVRLGRRTACLAAQFFDRAEQFVQNLKKTKKMLPFFRRSR